MSLRVINAADRLALSALAVVDVGAGVFLVGVGLLPNVSTLHAVVGVLALLLALPALAAVATGRLTQYADEGVLVNVAVLTFVTLEVFWLPAALAQRSGLALILLGATVATVGLYLRLFGVLRGHVADVGLAEPVRPSARGGRP